ncbi:alanine racemase [Candidatus Kapabacteria bacterium]|nr:alanine racemase [Candidatus Kapabacteria bacterium]
MKRLATIKTTSYIEISKSALKNNLNFINSNLSKKTVFSSVVKGNAYGHGIETFVPLALELGVNHFSCFSAEEAFRVHSIIGENGTLLIMGSIFDDQIEWAILNKIEFFVFNYNTLNTAILISDKLKRNAFIHLEIETGMNRTGFDFNELENVFNLVQNHKYVTVKGICTHLAGAESISNYKRIKVQLKTFKSVKGLIKTKNEINPIYHSLCSAGFLSYPKHKADLVRIGILQYGFFPSNENYIQYITKNKINSNPLIRVISWKSRIMDIKNVKIGEFIGYGTSYFTNIDTKIAIVPIGYSNGFARKLSNSGKVLINGSRHDVVGVVNMNMLAVNISELENANIGDEVVLIGNQGNLEISVSSFSDFSNLLNYELLTRLPSNITRTIID